MPSFVVKTTDIDGSDLRTIEPVHALTFGYTLSDSGTCTFEAPNHQGLTEDVVQPGTRHIEVFRDTDRVWAGRLWQYDWDSSDNLIRCEARGYYELLRHKFFIPKHTEKYVDEDVWDIAWDLIQYAQSLRDMGFTRGMGGESGKPHTDQNFYWYDFSSIAEMIETVATLPGKSFYFTIDQDRVWKTYTKPGPDNDYVVLEQGVNVESLTVNKSGLESASEAFVKGDGDGRDTHYGYLLNEDVTDIFGRLGIVIDRPDVRSDNTLADLADLAAHRHANIRVQLEVVVSPDVVPWGNFGVGENLHLVWNDDFVQLDDFYRIAAISTEITEAGRAKTTLTFDSQWDSAL